MKWKSKSLFTSAPSFIFIHFLSSSHRISLFFINLCPFNITFFDRKKSTVNKRKTSCKRTIVETSKKIKLKIITHWYLLYTFFRTINKQIFPGIKQPTSRLKCHSPPFDRIETNKQTNVRTQTSFASRCD